MLAAKEIGVEGDGRGDEVRWAEKVKIKASCGSGESV